MAVMWTLGRSFGKALRREAKRLHIGNYSVKDDNPDEDDRLFSCGKPNVQGLYSMTPVLRGRLVAQLIGQAEADGATSLRFNYGTNTIVCTIEGKDYDIVPPPPPEVLEIVRAIVRVFRAKGQRSGSLRLAFADATVDLTATQHPLQEHSYLEITGFTASPDKIARFHTTMSSPPVRIEAHRRCCGDAGAERTTD